MARNRKKRVLIVNADDFGQSPGVNQGIIAAHERGIVTSASLMVRWPDAADAAAYARRHNELSVGIHFDIGESAHRKNEWVKLYEVVSETDVDGVAREVRSQLAKFEKLMGRPPSHIDSHQHIHLRRRLQPIFRDVAERLKVPLRSRSSTIRYCGRFYAQNERGESFPECISVKALVGMFLSLPPGVTELGCHPGTLDGLNSMYRKERVIEVRTLCDPRIPAAIREHGITLRSFHNFTDAF